MLVRVKNIELVTEGNTCCNGMMGELDPGGFFVTFSEPCPGGHEAIWLPHPFEQFYDKVENEG